MPGISGLDAYFAFEIRWVFDVSIYRESDNNSLYGARYPWHQSKCLHHWAYRNGNMTY